jgi:hypothetical protein
MRVKSGEVTAQPGSELRIGAKHDQPKQIVDGHVQRLMEPPVVRRPIPPESPRDGLGLVGPLTERERLPELILE